MNKLFRRLRGLLGVGVMWGAMWAVVGAIIGVVAPESWT